MAEDTNPLYVLDTLFVLAFLLPDEKHSQVETLFTKHQKHQLKLTAPEIQPYEVVNGLRSAIVQKRITTQESKLLYSGYKILHIKLHPTKFEASLALALKHHLSIYDAAYLELAHRLQTPLLSLDTRLTQLSPKPLPN